MNVNMKKPTPQEWVEHAERKKECGMSTWNFRLIDLSDENNGGDPWIELCEAHYNDKGVPVGYTEPYMGSETIEGIRQLVAWYALALDKPILKKADFVGSFNYVDKDDDDE